ncbi:MAG: adenosine kinase [Chitinophagaceae bacterium]|nr:adenosine kinase [Chitinophagaceae bacterium]
MKKKKYDVFGIGNAVVDVVVSVEDSFLKKYNIEKGIMTLIDAERQKQLLDSLFIQEDMMQAAGSSGNTLIGLHQFGGTAYFACKLGNDHFGKFYLKTLKDYKITTNMRDDNTFDEPTAKCLVMVTEDAQRTLNTFLGTSATFSKNEINQNELIHAKYLYMEGYLVSTDLGLDAMKYAKNIAEKSNVKTALSFSDTSMVKYFSNRLEEVIGASVDVLFCNVEEALIYTKKNSLLEAREELKKIAKTFVITMGANGSMLFDGDTFIDIEPYPVIAVDTVGAGDLFAGAFLFSITHKHSFIEAGKIASLASSKLVETYGPRITDKQVEFILQHIHK